jgi:hypothetical protein
VLLSVDMDGKWHYPRFPDEADRLVAALVDKAWNDAWFCFGAEECTQTNLVPCAYLNVSVNVETGFGALIWGVSDGFAGDLPDGVWTSDNPEPPTVDPRVLADPDSAAFHDPRSTLPIPRILAAVGEFCRTGTGERPTGVSWAEGHLDGTRI